LYVEVAHTGFYGLILIFGRVGKGDPTPANLPLGAQRGVMSAKRRWSKLENPTQKNQIFERLIEKRARLQETAAREKTTHTHRLRHGHEQKTDL
jgi:hypothetical protein